MVTLPSAASTVHHIPLGRRVVIRYRIEGGLTDALGYLGSVTNTECTVQTRTGDVVIALELIRAAKQVPPPPARRPTRQP